MSEQHRFVFIHIPKNAGTTVQAALQVACVDAMPRPRRVPLLADFFDTYTWNEPWHHALASEVKAQLGEHRWGEFFSFAFVRNPWARMVSLYNMLLIDQRQRWLKDVRNFADFLEKPAGALKAREHLSDQTGYVSDEQGTRIVDFIGRFESLAEDFNCVCRRLGVVAELGRMNPSLKVDYRDYYTPQLRQLVAERYRRDIAGFGYRF
jgi:hypothetical protein